MIVKPYIFYFDQRGGLVENTTKSDVDLVGYIDLELGQTSRNGYVDWLFEIENHQLQHVVVLDFFQRSKRQRQAERGAWTKRDYFGQKCGEVFGLRRSLVFFFLDKKFSKVFFFLFS